MVSTRILILAHGDQTRLSELGHPKQLLPINSNESIIERTLRLFEKVSSDITIVAPRDAHWESLEEKHQGRFKILSIYPGDFVLHGLWQTSPLWTGAQKLLVLLGDVVYSELAVQQLSAVESFTFVGRSGSSAITGKLWGELFGLVVPERDFGALLQTLGEDWTTGGKLWDLLRRMKDTWRRPFAFVDLLVDYTEDIDTPEDVSDVLPKLQELVHEEDLRLVIDQSPKDK